MTRPSPLQSGALGGIGARDRGCVERREAADRAGGEVEVDRVEVAADRDCGKRLVAEGRGSVIGVSIGRWLKSANSTIAEALDGQLGSHRRRGDKFHHKLGR